VSSRLGGHVLQITRWRIVCYGYSSTALKLVQALRDTNFAM
jgi:hypothetical protein